VLYPAHDGQEQREWPGGCEDPRLVEGPDGTFILTYAQHNRSDIRLAVATSKDLRHWTKHGPVFRGNAVRRSQLQVGLYRQQGHRRSAASREDRRPLRDVLGR